VKEEVEQKELSQGSRHFNCTFCSSGCVCDEHVLAYGGNSEGALGDFDEDMLMLFSCAKEIALPYNDSVKVERECKAELPLQRALFCRWETEYDLSHCTRIKMDNTCFF